MMITVSELEAIIAQTLAAYARRDQPMADAPSARRRCRRFIQLPHRHERAR
jgi:hypothetical protein